MISFVFFIKLLFYMHIIKLTLDTLTFDLSNSFYDA
jgi:hypothetical protein